MLLIQKNEKGILFRTDKENQLTSKFLTLASEEFGSRGCNDVEERFWDGWSKEERQQFVKEYYMWNGDPENFNPNYLHIPDFAIMHFLSYKVLCKK